jgi:hypothetical protein
MLQADRYSSRGFMQTTRKRFLLEAQMDVELLEQQAFSPVGPLGLGQIPFVFQVPDATGGSFFLRLVDTVRGVVVAGDPKKPDVDGILVCVLPVPLTGHHQGRLVVELVGSESRKAVWSQTYSPKDKPDDSPVAREAARLLNRHVPADGRWSFVACLSEDGARGNQVACSLGWPQAVSLLESYVLDHEVRETLDGLPEA